jgi:GT2 family glycosyltransferase
MLSAHEAALAVVIPVFNRWAFTKACLDSLAKQTVHHFSIWIVDDGSTDGTLEQLAQYPAVHVLQTKGDVFWTGTVNVGIKAALAAGAKRVMTLNNDVLCPPTFMEGMLLAAEAMPDALVGALALEGEQKPKVAYAGEQWHWLTDSVSKIEASHQYPLLGLHAVSHFPGRGLLIPRACIEKIGLFDERRFPHYMADYDYTMVARRAGFQIVVNYDAPLLTYPEASGDRLLRSRKSWPNYVKHLTDIRGGGNLLNFWRYSFKNCPPLLLPINLAVGTGKRLLGYWLSD